MTPSPRLDLAPLLRLFATRTTVGRALLVALVPLGLAAIAGGGALAGGSDVVAGFAAVGLFVLPWTAGTVLGVTLAELRARPVTRLLPGRRRRTGRACALVGLTTTVACAAALTPAVPEAPLLGAVLLAWSGFALAVAVGGHASPWGFVVVQILAVTQVGNSRSLLEGFRDWELFLYGLAIVATCAFAAAFTAKSERRSAWDGRTARGTRRIERSPEDAVPGRDAAGLDRALAAARHEARTASDRRDPASLVRLAAFVVVIAVVGPLGAALWRADEVTLRSVLTALHEAFVGRPRAGEEPGDGIAGTGATLAFALSILPFVAAAPFHGRTHRPFSRATLARLAFAVWWRVLVTGAVVFVASWLAVTVALGAALGAPVPYAVPTFVWTAVLLAPLAPWMTLAVSAARAAGERRGAGPASLATVGAFALCFSIGATSFVVARDPDGPLRPTPLSALAHLGLLAAGVAVLRAHFARQYVAGPLAPARPSTSAVDAASLRDGAEKRPAAAPG
ncbi:MAG: hypothetical protein AAGB93_04770 [Planctomycetota bacterium]